MHEKLLEALWFLSESGLLLKSLDIQAGSFLHSVRDFWRFDSKKSAQWEMSSSKEESPLVKREDFLLSPPTRCLALSDSVWVPEFQDHCGGCLSEETGPAELFSVPLSRLLKSLWAPEEC